MQWSKSKDSGSTDQIIRFKFIGLMVYVQQFKDLFKFGGSSSRVQSERFKIEALYSTVLALQFKFYVPGLTVPVQRSKLNGSRSTQVHRFQIYGASSTVRVRGLCLTVEIQLFKFNGKVQRYQL